MCWLTLSKAGLILNAIGSIVLVIGSNMMTNLLTDLIDSIKDSYGYNFLDPIDNTLLKRFDRDKKRSATLNKMGFGLFATGFLLQLL